MRRVASLLFTAAAILVFLMLLGVAVYIGVFAFLAIAIYFLVVGIKDEFFKKHHKPRNGDENYESGVIDMGEVEIISPRALGEENVLWRSTEGLPLGLVYVGDTPLHEDKVLLLAVKIRRGGAIYLEVLSAGENRKYSLDIRKISQVREANGPLISIEQFLRKKGIG